MRLAKALRMQGDQTADKSLYDEAAGLLSGVINRGDVPAGLQATALYVLAEVHESQRDIDSAKAAYTRLMDEPRYLGSPFQLLARQRLDSVSDVAYQVQFEPGNRPLETMPAAKQDTASAPAVAEPAAVGESGTPQQP